MDKEQLLKQIEEECRKAELPLKERATNLVFGKGRADVKIIFVGEAPGKNEDLQGKPFVGAAGKNLDKLLKEVGASLEEVYIANILKYRPPENRAPLPDEIKAHTPWLIEQIKIIKPEVVCSLGNYATKFFLAGLNCEGMEKQPGITGVHGKIKEIEFGGWKFKLIPLFHPAAIIYNRNLMGLWEKDMNIVKKEIGRRSITEEKAEKKEEQERLFSFGCL